MAQGKGYISTNAGLVTFTGVPYEGTLALPLTGNASTRFNLIGNPYPSSVSAASIFTENAGQIVPALHFWDDDNSAGAGFDPADYVVVGILGVSAVGNGTPWTGHIAAGQSFFVQSASISNTFTFNNAMRNANAATFFEDNADLKRISGTPYDIKDGKYTEEQLLDTENPSGTFLCPEYWCMKDQIPLQDSQLDKEEGEIRCPVCHGKLQTRSTDNPRTHPLIKRETGFLYPGFKDYKSPRNGRQMPCCFKKPRTKVADKKQDDKYYVLNEDKSIDAERIAFLPKKILESLAITETYEMFSSGTVRRLMSPNKGYFRAGLGHPSETLPAYLGIKTKIPSPRESIATAIKCSFVHTWKRLGDKHLDHIVNEIQKLPEFSCDFVIEGLAKIISGMDEAFRNKEMSPIEELEYSALGAYCSSLYGLYYMSPHP
jgi:hypothetical protein